MSVPAHATKGLGMRGCGMMHTRIEIFVENMMAPSDVFYTDSFQYLLFYELSILLLPVSLLSITVVCFSYAQALLQNTIISCSVGISILIVQYAYRISFHYVNRTSILIVRIRMSIEFL